MSYRDATLAAVHAARPAEMPLPDLPTDAKQPWRWRVTWPPRAAVRGLRVATLCSPQRRHCEVDRRADRAALPRDRLTI